MTNFLQYTLKYKILLNTSKIPCKYAKNTIFILALYFLELLYNDKVKIKPKKNIYDKTSVYSKILCQP